MDPITKDKIDYIFAEFKNGLTLDGRAKVFELGKELKSDFLVDRSKPEPYTKRNLIEKLFRLFEIRVTSDEKDIDFEAIHKWVDYRLKNHREVSFLLEAKPLNADLFVDKSDGAIRQIQRAFKNVDAYKQNDFGIATDGKKWVFINRDGHIVSTLDLLSNFDQIKKLLTGEDVVPIKTPEEDITNTFYQWYNALLHGGEYKDHTGRKKKIAVSDCLVENILSVPTAEERESIAQTVMDRLVFIKFLQSKQLIDFDILEYFLEFDEGTINGMLRQLFFSVFNTEKHKRGDVVHARFKDIPYLNGSLFVRSPVEYEYSDYTISVSILKKVIDFLNSFKFIHIEESSGEKVLDPEILGYIFERAMTATDRKGSGAYYTPKPITRYIARNAIHSALLRKINHFLKQRRKWKKSQFLKNINEIYELRKEQLGDALIESIFVEVVQSLKICDNACGSGAFLLAAADVLFEIYAKMSGILRLRSSDVALKKVILQNNLYGVDKNPNAGEIAKLRLWLWLVDSYTPERLEAVEALPNIDYNIRTGNSLLGFVDLSKFKDREITLLDYATIKGQDILSEKKDILVSVLLKQRDALVFKYKNKTGEEARSLYQQIEIIDAKIKPILNENLLAEIREKIPVSTNEFQMMQPFHWGLEFHEAFSSTNPDSVGFDVIISNPPYIRVELADHQLMDIYKFLYSAVHKRADVYVAFIQTSFERINKHGAVGLITENQYMIAEYGSKTRGLLAQTYSLSKIINFKHYPVFRGLSTYTAIVIGSKTTEKKTFCMVFKSEEAVEYAITAGLSDELEHPKIKRFTLEREYLTEEVWILLGKEEQKIRTKIIAGCDTKLGDPAISLIGSPLTTGRDAVLRFKFSREDDNFFYVTSAGKEQKLEKGIWRRLLTARLLDKWVYKEPTHIVFFPYVEANGKYELIRESEFKSKFPLTYKFLLESKTTLLARKDSRKTWDELGRSWYSLHRVGAPANFERAKILSQTDINKPMFSLDLKKNLFPHGRVDGIALAEKIDPYFLLAYLNSSLIFYWLKTGGPDKRGGYIELDVGFVSEIPLPKDDLLSDTLGNLAKEILNNLSLANKLESRIDQILYRSFKINKKEQEIIETEIK